MVCFRSSRDAFAIAGIYAAVATVWILLSGWMFDLGGGLLGLNIADPALRLAFEYGKGLTFVLVTAILLWLLVRRALRREQAIASEREAALRTLAQSERMAMAGLLASGLAHEFNNLHAVIQGNLELARAAGVADPRLDKRLEGAHSALERASGLTRSLLNFARPGTDERQPVRLDRIAAETIELVRRALEAEGILVEQDLQPVPEILGDQHQLGQVVMNLLINARHALRSASVKRLRVATRCRGEVMVEVADSGCGMSAETKRQIFTPFFTTKRGDGEGTGLGLSVSLSMIEAHGGRIEVESVLGQGTTFTIFLPLRPDNGTGHA